MARDLPPGIQSREHAPRGTTRKRTQYRVFISDSSRKTASGRVARISSAWFDTLAEAKEWQAERKGESRSGTLAAARDLRVGEACDAWLKTAKTIGHQGRKPIRQTTWERQDITIRNHIKPTIGTLKMAELGAPDVRKWVIEQVEERGRQETGRALDILKGAYDHAVEIGQLRANPASAIRLSKRESDDEDDVGIVSEFMQPDEVARILRAADDLAEKGYVGSEHDFARNESFGHLKVRAKGWADRYRPLVYFLLATGTRIGEANGVQWKHIDLEAGEVHIEQSVNQKGVVGPTKTKSSIRHIPVGPIVIEMLKAMPGKRDPEHFVFGGDAPTKPANRRNLHARCWVALMVAAGMLDEDEGTYWSFHDCRHFFASLLIDQGTEAQQVCDLLGHANVTTTLRIYTHLFKAKRGRMNKAARQLESVILALPAA